MWLMLPVLVAQSVYAVQAARIDVREFRLPNRYTAIIAACGVLGAIARSAELYIVIAVLLVSALHVLPNLLGKAWIGMGDAKLIAGLGLSLTSIESVLAWLWLAYAVAAVVGLLLQKIHLSQKIPFGPYLTATWIAVVMGDYARVAMAYSR